MILDEIVRYCFKNKKYFNFHCALTLYVTVFEHLVESSYPNESLDVFLSHCNTHFIFRIRQAIIPVSVDTGLNSHLISGSHHFRLYFGRNMWSVSK